MACSTQVQSVMQVLIVKLCVVLIESHMFCLQRVPRRMKSSPAKKQPMWVSVWFESHLSDLAYLLYVTVQAEQTTVGLCSSLLEGRQVCAVPASTSVLKCMNDDNVAV